jgi:hypothetical protein
MHLMAKCKLVPFKRALMRIAPNPAVSKRNADRRIRREEMNKR